MVLSISLGTARLEMSGTSGNSEDKISRPRFFGYVLGRTASENEGFEKGVGGKAVGAVDAGVGAFAHGIKTVDVGFGVEVDVDSAHEIVLAGENGEWAFVMSTPFQGIFHISWETLFKEVLPL